MLLKIGLPQTIFFHVANLGWFWGSPILRNFKEMHHPLDHGWPSQKKAASNTYERTFLKLVGQCGSLTNLSCRLHERLTSGPNWPVFLKPFHVHFITMKKLSCCNVRAEKNHQVVTPSGSPSWIMTSLPSYEGKTYVFQACNDSI